MQYDNICFATFLSRPNRFIAQVFLEGREETVHVKNTGRCRELLLPGASVVLQAFPPGKRRTNYDLIAVYKNGRLINMDSQAPNKAVKEWLSAGKLWPAPTILRSEQTFGSSRFDFYLESDMKKAFLEVKGVTLEQDDAALFPDAPTLRGVKHLHELQQAIEQGYEAFVLFVIQMQGVTHFSPNTAAHPAFTEALRQVSAAGVQLLAYECLVTPNSLSLSASVPVLL